MSRRNYKKSIAIILVVLIILSFAACGGQREDSLSHANKTEISESTANPDEMHFQAKAIPLPAEIGVPVQVKSKGNAIYVYGNAQPDTLYLLDLDGEIKKEIDLHLGNGALQDIAPSTDGSVWILTETWNTDSGELDAAEICNLKDSSTEHSFSCYHDDFVPMWLTADDERQCLYIAEPTQIYALDYQGNELFTISGNGFFHPCFTADGDFAVCEIVGDNVTVHVLDFEKQDWKTSFMPDIQYRKLFSGLTYDLYCSDGKQLCGMDINTGTSQPLFSLLEAGIGSDTFYIAALSESRFLVASDSGLFLVGKGSSGDQIELIMACIQDYDLVSQEALRFNRTQEAYKITVRDYSTYNTDDTNAGAIDQLNLDIASGDAPDIYALKGMPVAQYAQLGLLEDLLPYLPSTGLSADDFVPSFLSAMKIDGKLYSLIPHVCIRSIWTSPEILNGKNSLSFQEMLDLSGGEDPFCGDLTRYDFMQAILAGNNSSFLNWQQSESYFDSEEFKSALSLSMLLPERTQAEEFEKNPTTYIPNNEPRKLVFNDTTDFLGVIYNSGQLDCLNGSNADAVPIGIPGFKTSEYLIYPSGLYWGMSSTSLNKDAVWVFLANYVTSSYQSKNGIPILRTSMEQWKEAMGDIPEAGGSVYMIVRGEEIDMPFTPDDYTRIDETITQLVNSVNDIYDENPAIMQIIWSEAQAYYAGDKAVDEAAKNIQSRVSIYMSEQG